MATLTLTLGICDMRGKNLLGPVMCLVIPTHRSPLTENHNLGQLLT